MLSTFSIDNALSYIGKELLLIAFDSKFDSLQKKLIDFLLTKSIYECNKKIYCILVTAE